jgi:hypothetical protein
MLPRSAQEKPDPPRCSYALIDKRGVVLTATRFEEVQDFSEGLAAVRINDSWGYVDKAGILRITERFQEANEFKNGLALVGLRSNRKDRGSWEYGYIDKSGRVVIPARFAAAQSFSEGMAAVKDDYDGPYYYIDATGRRALPQSFSLASSFVGGLAHVMPLLKNDVVASPFDRHGEYAYIDRSGKAVFKYKR